MTKKDYKNIAAILSQYKDTEFRNYNDKGGESIFGLGIILEDFISMFLKDNPRFNETKFKEAVFGNALIK